MNIPVNFTPDTVEKINSLHPKMWREYIEKSQEIAARQDARTITGKTVTEAIFEIGNAALRRERKQEREISGDLAKQGYDISGNFRVSWR